MTPLFASAQSSSSNDDGAALFGLLVCCGIPVVASIAIIIWMNRNRQPYITGTQTPIPVEQVLQTAVQTYTLDSYQVTSHTTGNVTFTRQTRPNMAFVILLLITGILPGILYWVLANKPFSVNVVAAPQGSVTSVNITSSVTGFGGKTTADKLIATLPRPAGLGSITLP